MIIQGKIWGHTTPLFNKNNVEVHIAQIKKGGYCSKHIHKHKFNQFIVLKGKLQISIWKQYAKEEIEDITILTEFQECIVNPNDPHKFLALEDTTVLELYWVELNEVDIVREDHGGMIDEKATDISCEEYEGRIRKAVIFDPREEHASYFGYGQQHSMR